MRENRDRFMLCCDCGYAVKEKAMFKKTYKHTGICLCKSCAKKLRDELLDFTIGEVRDMLEDAE